MKNFFSAIIMLAIGGVMLWMGYRDFATARKLATTGKNVEATVLSGSKSVTRRGFRSYYLKVTFSPLGHGSVTSEIKVPKDAYEDGLARRRVPILYLREDPAICGTGTIPYEVYLFLLGGVGMIVWVVLASISALRQRQQAIA